MIARRKEDSGKVKVLLHWTPEDMWVQFSLEEPLLHEGTDALKWNHNQHSFSQSRLSVFVSQTAGRVGERERPTTDENQSGSSLTASSGYSRVAGPQHVQVIICSRPVGLDASRWHRDPKKRESNSCWLNVSVSCWRWSCVFSGCSSRSWGISWPADVSKLKWTCGSVEAGHSDYCFFVFVFLMLKF